MRNTLKLRNPVYIDGEEVHELEYDPEEITVELFEETARLYGASATTKEMNDRIHLGLFWAAVMAVNDKVSFSELNNAKGMYDLTRMMDIGRDFIMGSDGSAENDSDPASVIMPKLSTLEPEKSENGD